MGIRFRKRIKIAPGIKLNITEKGVRSASVGGKGVTMNVGGKRGAKLTASVPGTGVSHTTQLTSGPRGRKRQEPAPGAGSYSGASVVIAIIIVALLIWFFAS